MADTGPSYVHRIRAGVWPGVGLGLLVGAAEVVLLALDLRQPLGFFGFAGIGVLALLANAALGASCAVLAGAVVHLEPPDPDAPRRPTTLATLLARQIAGGALLHAGGYLWEAAARLAMEDGSPASVGALAALPFGWAAVVYFQARFWLRRAEWGPVPRFAVVAGGLPAAVLLVATAIFALDGTGGTAPPRTPSIVLVTIDGLRADAVSLRATPALDGLALDGVRFADAVTPTGETRGANASVLVGLHPLRHHVLSDHHALSRAYRSVFEVLAGEGWATGAFVSGRAAAAGSGLAQGFAVFDDALGPWSFVTRVHVFDRAAALADLARGSGGAHRSAVATVERFGRWLEQSGDEPFAAWIHLDEPHVAASEGGDYAAAVTAVDGAVARVRELIGRRGDASPTGVIVVGTHGELLGAHGGRTNRTLYDEVVHVPLIVSLPGLPVDAPVVEPQVCTMDVAATIADWLRAPSLDESEGIPLTGYVAGARAATIWCSLVGRDLEGRWILGLRNNGVKVVRKPGGGEELYDLRGDPQEADDRAAEQREVILQARSLLASDAAALDAWLR